MKRLDIRLDYAPRGWQHHCHESLKRFNVLVLHRRSGKTELAVMELINSALKSSHSTSLFAYIAPLYTQAKTVAWDRLKRRLKAVHQAGLARFNEVETSITFAHNNACIRLFGADNPHALRGAGFDGVVMDEVGQIKPEVWQDIVRPALSDRQGWTLFIGTPWGINLFSELYFSAQGKKDWFTARYTVYETQSLLPDEIKLLEQDESTETFAREFLCDFFAAAADQLISLIDVEQAAQRVIKLSDFEHAPRIMGVDVARFGGDRTVIFKRQGLFAFEPMVFNDLDNMEVAARVADESNKWKPHAVFIDQGGGAGVIDRLKQTGFSVTAVNFGSRAIDSNQYVNLRSEMWFKMKDWIVYDKGVIPDNTSLKQELSAPFYSYGSQDRKALESKDNIKKRLKGGLSPDLADALALTFAMPVNTGNIDGSNYEAVRMNVKRRGASYDPYRVAI